MARLQEKKPGTILVICILSAIAGTSAVLYLNLGIVILLGNRQLVFNRHKGRLKKSLEQLLNSIMLKLDGYFVPAAIHIYWAKSKSCLSYFME